MQKIHPEIYKLDSKRKTRVWWMEQDGDKHRTHSGIKDGAITTTGWTQCEATNVGRSNERDPVAQATFEIEAQYEKKLSREYHKTLETVSQGAHFFKPMLAGKYSKFSDGYAQPKLDGVRCIATKAGLFSRQGKPIPGAPHIHEALECLFEFDPDLILDGELYNHDFKDNFNEIISLVRKENPSPDRLKAIVEHVQYHVYDIPSHPGPFEERTELLDDIISDLGHESIFDVTTYRCETQEEFDDLHGLWLSEGYEGSMWRCPNTTYEQKRSKSLLKRKEFQDAEFEVVEIQEGLGNWSGLAKRVVCLLPDGRQFGAGIKGSMDRAKELLNETHKVVTVQFFEYTPDGVPRFPVAIKFHGEARTL